MICFSFAINICNLHKINKIFSFLSERKVSPIECLKAYKTKVVESMSLSHNDRLLNLHNNQTRKSPVPPTDFAKTQPLKGE